MKRILFILCLLTMAVGSAFADAVAIDHFVVKDNPFAKSEVAIIATDTSNNILENISGVFNFSVNGVSDTLKFEKGTAFYRHKIDHSTFLYVKHENETGTHSALFYVYKSSDKLIPFHISWVWLLIIPASLVLLGYMFKRFIIIAIVIFCIFLYFNHSNGLSIPTFFESIIDGLKRLV